MRNDTKRRDKEAAIYRAVLELLAQGAEPGELRVQQIAEAADIGKGTIYEYFSSKEEILHGLTAYCLEGELDRLEAALAGCATLDGLLDGLLDYLCALAQERVGIYRVLAVSLGRSGNCRPDPAVPRRLDALVRAAVDRLRAEGGVDPSLDEGYCLYALYAASASCLLSLSAPQAADRQPQVRRNVRLLLRRALCPLA